MIMVERSIDYKTCLTVKVAQLHVRVKQEEALTRIA